LLTSHCFIGLWLTGYGSVVLKPHCGGHVRQLTDSPPIKAMLDRYALYKKTMKKNLIILSLLLAGLSSCKKQVEKDRPEFIGYWSGGSYMEYGYMYIDIDENSKAHVYAYDYENEHEYNSRGTARVGDDKLKIGGIKYFKIIEYPHPIDTTVEKHDVINHLDNTCKLAIWKMVLDGLKSSSNLNVGQRTYYKAD
jgi:hypothetical protein